ncbi:hypothetical protein GCM10010413_24360 [Promicromonospora sukumoe]
MPQSPLTASDDAVIDRRSGEWAGVNVTVRTEMIRVPVEWSSELEFGSVVVNLGGTTSRMEGALGRGTRYLGPPTLGEMSIIPPQERFGGVYSGEYVRYATVVVGPDASARTPRLRAGLGVTDPFIFGAVRELAKLTGSDDPTSVLFAESIAFALRLHLERAHTADAAGSHAIRSPGAVTIARVQEHIAENLQDKLTLASLAGVAGTSVQRLVAGFRDELRTTPARYVLERRVRRARWLLAHTTMPLVDIAFECGLSSQSHLTTTFRKHTGATPGAYRSTTRSDLAAHIP